MKKRDTAQITNRAPGRVGIKLYLLTRMHSALQFLAFKTQKPISK